jgi:hypothetical protein
MGSAWCMPSLDRTFVLCPATIGLAAMLLASANLFYRASCLMASSIGRPLNLVNITRRFRGPSRVLASHRPSTSLRRQRKTYAPFE